MPPLRQRLFGAVWNAPPTSRILRQRWLAAIELRLSRVDGGRAVRTADLDALKLNEWVDAAFAEFAIDVSERIGRKTEGGPEGEKQLRAAAADFQRARRGGDRQRVTGQRVKEAARIYRENFDDHPIKAVADAMGVQPRQASNLITLARSPKYQFLSETTKGKKAL